MTENQKLGWSGHVVDLCSDSSSEEEERQNRRRRPRKRTRFHENAGVDGGTAVASLLGPDMAQYGVARLPSAREKRRAISDNHVIALDDEQRPSAPPMRIAKRNRQRIACKSVETNQNAVSFSDDMYTQVISNDDSSVEEVIVSEIRKQPATPIDSGVELVSVTRTTTPMDRILEVFPDVDVSHGELLLVKLGVSQEGLRLPVQQIHEQIIQSALSNLAEGSYPKSKNPSAAGFTPVHDGAIVQRSGHAKAYKYDYMSASSFTPTQEYINQAITTLMTDFPFLAKACIQKHLAECQNHYAIFHHIVCNCVMGKTEKASTKANAKDDESKQYFALTSALAGNAVAPRQVRRLKKLKGITTILKRPRRNKKVAPLAVTDPTLKDEIEYVKHKQETWMNEMTTKMMRAEARKESERAGSTMECQCCFADVAMEEMISCQKEGHLFCVDCLRRFAEEQVFGQGNLGIDKNTKTPALELKCMFGDGCTSGFEPEFVRKALPEKVLAKYDELQFQAAVEKAGVQDLCTCPKCGFQAVLPPTEMIFRCPVQDCLHESCRKCGEVPHIPLRCEEVEKKSETEGRLRVEEAISQAKIRTCPKPGCGRKFVKSDGCNKMTCSCGTYVCYVCRSEIPRSVGYKHFCQQPHCSHTNCKKCPLHSNVEEDDLRAMREAGIQAAEDVRKESLTDTTLSNQRGSNSDEVRINVDSLLKNPSPRKRGDLRVR